MITVRLLCHTPEPEKIVAAAAKLCYSPVGIRDLMDGLDGHSTADFVRMLAAIGHESPLEHASFTFGIEGVSRSLLAQITRHRIASYSVQSQRYVEKAGFEAVMPPEIAGDDETAALFREAMDAAGRYYERLTETLAQRHEAALLSAGESSGAARSKAKKQAIEDARFVLPNACDTRLIMTINARSLLNFFAHRCCNRAQWEIRTLADEMLRLVTEAAPNLFSGAGPGCLFGPCPEGKMNCGKIVEVREKYRQIKEQPR